MSNNPSQNFLRNVLQQGATTLSGASSAVATESARHLTKPIGTGALTAPPHHETPSADLFRADESLHESAFFHQPKEASDSGDARSQEVVVPQADSASHINDQKGAGAWHTVTEGSSEAGADDSLTVTTQAAFQTHAQRSKGAGTRIGHEASEGVSERHTVADENEGRVIANRSSVDAFSPVARGGVTEDASFTSKNASAQDVSKTQGAFSDSRSALAESSKAPGGVLDESGEHVGTRLIVLRKAQGAAESSGETNSRSDNGGQSPRGADAPRIQFQDLGKVRPFREMQLNPPNENTRADPPGTLAVAARRVVPAPETEGVKAGESLQLRTAAQTRGDASILPPAPRQIEDGSRSAARGPFQPPREESPRLIINRLDVQVVNQPPAPAVPTMPAPRAEPYPSVESWDSLDRHHLGHVRFML